MTIDSFRIFIVFLSLLFSFSACDEEEPPFALQAGMEEATDITQTTATLTAFIYPKDRIYENVEFILIDTAAIRLPWIQSSESCDEPVDGKYIATVEDLKPGTTYAYYLSVYSGDIYDGRKQWIMSEQKYFTTLPNQKEETVLILKVVSMGKNAIFLSASWKGAFSQRLGFIVTEYPVGTEIPVKPDHINLNGVDIKDMNPGNIDINNVTLVFSASINGLKPKTSYSIKPFISSWNNIEKMNYGEAVKIYVDQQGNISMNDSIISEE